jgi:ribosomal protein S18 acetylase RimI-like enzyme
MKLEMAKIDALETIVSLYKNAIKNLEENNIFQWEDEVYPDEKCLKNDIIKNEMYAGILNGKIISTLVINKEFPDTYSLCNWRYNGNKFMVLHRLCVDVEYQKQGIGTETMKMLEEYLKNKEIESVRLDVFSKNPMAIKMYEKLGYKKVGEQNIWKGIFDIYEKIL